MSAPVTVQRLEVITALLPLQEVGRHHSGLGWALHEMNNGGDLSVEQICRMYRRQIARLYDMLDRLTAPTQVSM